MEASAAAGQDPPVREPRADDPDRPGRPDRPDRIDAPAGGPLGGTAAYVAELLGTFTLVFFICAVVSVNSPTGLGFTDFSVIGLVHAFVLMLLIYALGSASGAHFNPAVTIALLARRKIGGTDAVIYILVQFIGAILAALLVKLLLDDEGASVNYGAPAISEAPAAVPGQPAAAGPNWLDGSVLGGFAVEALGTFFLMLAIMATAVNPHGPRNWAGFVIGATLGFAVMTLAPLTGASFNPARAFGPDLVSGEWDAIWMYLLAPIVGAVLAAFAYTVIVLRPQERVGARPIDTYDE